MKQEGLAGSAYEVGAPDLHHYYPELKGANYSKLRLIHTMQNTVMLW